MLIAYSAQSRAGWEIYDDFNDSAFDATKWSNPFSSFGYQGLPFSELNGALRGFIPKGINEGPGTSYDFLPLSSTFIEGLKGVRVKLFVSDTCSEDDVVSYMNFSISSIGLKYNSQNSHSYMTFVINNNEYDRLSVASSLEGIRRFTANLDTATYSDPSRLTGKWIKITQFFANPKNLRFWTNLDNAEAQIRYTNRGFTAKSGGSFSIFMSGDYVASYPNETCFVWVDNVDIYR